MFSNCYPLNYLYLINLWFLSSSRFQSFRVLFNYVLLESFFVFSFFLLISLHEIKNIDGIHVKIRQILWSLHLLINLQIHCLCPCLPFLQKIINQLFSKRMLCCFKDRICSIFKHLLHFYLSNRLCFLSYFLLLNYQSVPFQFYHLSFYYLLLYSVLCY